MHLFRKEIFGYYSYFWSERELLIFSYNALLKNKKIHARTKIPII